MNRPLAAVGGGLVGTVALSLLLLLFEVETRSRIRMFDAVARFVGVPGNTSVGFILFVVAGVVAWPLLFAAVQPSLPGDDPALQGMGLAILLWVAFVLLGRGDLSGPIILAFAGLTLLAHLAYGFVLGSAYARFTGRTPTGDSPPDQPETRW